MKERMSIVLFSGTVDKLLAASILATGAAAMDMDVDLSSRRGASRRSARARTRPIRASAGLRGVWPGDAGADGREESAHLVGEPARRQRDRRCPHRGVQHDDGAVWPDAQRPGAGRGRGDRCRHVHGARQGEQSDPVHLARRWGRLQAGRPTETPENTRSYSNVGYSNNRR